MSKEPEAIDIAGSRYLIRDLHSKAVINTDTNALVRAKAQKKLFKSKDERLERLEQDMAEVKGCLKDILCMLKALG